MNKKKESTRERALERWDLRQDDGYLCPDKPLEFVGQLIEEGKWRIVLMILERMRDEEEVGHKKERK